MDQTLCDLLPCQITNFVAQLITLIKIAVPILIIIYGMLDLGKSIVASKEEDIKKHRGIFLKRLLTGAAVFFIAVIAEFMVTIVNPNSADAQCIKKILSSNVNSCVGTIGDVK